MADIGSTLSKYTSSSELSNLLESDKAGIYFAKTYLALDGVTDDYDDLYALINTTINGADAEIWFKDGSALINSNIGTPSNIKLKFLNGAMLKPANGVVITGTNTEIEAGLSQIFDLSLGGTLAGTWSVVEVYPEWFNSVSTYDSYKDIFTCGSIALGNTLVLENFTRIPKLYNDFSDKSDGAITSIDSAQTFDIWDNVGNSSGLVVDSGYMVHGENIANNAAGYFEVTLDNKITRMGATFMFPEAAGGNVTLASFAQSIVAEHDLGNGIPDAGIHVSFNPTYASAIIYKAGGSTALGLAYYSEALALNTLYSVEVYIDGSTLYIILPDGMPSIAFTNAEIESLSSNFATFELFESTTSNTPAKVQKIWADDASAIKDGHIPTGLDIAKAINGYFATTTITVDGDGYSTLITDFDSADKTGFYYTGQNALNAPSASSLHCLTIRANAGYTVQYAWQLSDASVKYRRTKNNSVWGSWVTCIESSDRMLTTDSSGNSSVITDFDDATRTGFYYCNSNCTNAPTASAYYLTVNSSSSLYKLQRAQRLTDLSVVYERILNNGSWGSWTLIT